MKWLPRKMKQALKKIYRRFVVTEVKSISNLPLLEEMALEFINQMGVGKFKNDRRSWSTDVKNKHNLPLLEEMALAFANRGGWRNFTESNQGKKVFSFLFACAQTCSQNSIVLDVSAGQCRYKPFFRHTQYVAIDSAVGDLNWDYTQLDLIGDAMKMPIKTASIDVCLNFTSLEHYPDPAQAFREFSRVLKPDGNLFLYVPFVQAEHQIPHDFYRYTRYGLEHLCRQNGLEIQFLMPSNGFFETALNFMNQAIGLIESKKVRNQLRQVVNAQIKPVFDVQENANNVSVNFPSEPSVSQLPVVYCLSAVRPGKSVNSVLHKSKRELIQSIAACPVCHNDLEWSSASVYCSHCQDSYVIKNGIPNFLKMLEV